MQQNELKQSAALAALAYIPQNAIVGIGTGSTVSYFIEALASIKGRIEGTVASSQASAMLLKSRGLPVLDLNAAGEVAVYIDGADEVNQHHYLVKGGGAAHTREKIIATVAKQFICIVDASKCVEHLGKAFPVPIEVIPMARSYVARQLVALGADPVWRENCITDNGNMILDVHNLLLTNPPEMEDRLNTIPGVVECGIFGHRRADIVIIASPTGVHTRTKAGEPWNKQ